jgi:hydroxyacylglutathione hydrolase
VIIERFYEEKLAQASYLIGCGKTGEAIVIDANRNIGTYLDRAREKGLRITAVTETHIHADFVSGSRELAHAAGATLYLSDEGTSDWKYAFADEPNVRLIKDGDSLWVGNLRLDVMKTPGHTPEHITFLLTDTPASTEPCCAFTGDFVFAGDVGRPDLLERAAGIEGTMLDGAKTLFGSISRFKQLHDGLILWPGHGAGSACGKSLGGTPATSLGYERSANWGIRTDDESSFVANVLEGQPDPPPYFKEMKRINKVGSDFAHMRAVPDRLPASDVEDRLVGGNYILDIRDESRVATSYVPGSINIPLGDSFVKWAGWLVPYDVPIYLIAESEQQVRRAIEDLSLIGIDDIKGWYADTDLDVATTSVIPQVSVGEVAALRANESTVLDVRSVEEYQEGHIPGAINMPIAHIRDHYNRLSREKLIVVHCESGSRSAIAVSLLRSIGFENVENYPHGFNEYSRSGFPVEKEDAALSAAAK